MKINLQLIIGHLDLSNKNCSYLLTEQGDIITCELESNLYGTLQVLAQNCLQIESDWLDFKLVDVYEHDNNLCLVYTAMVPKIIDNKFGKWFMIGEINDKMVQAIVYQASHRIAF